MQFKVLIVEDRKDWRAILVDCMKLGLKDVEIETARDYPDAWNKLKNQTFDLLIVDPMLPDSNEGIMLLNNLFEDGVRTPVLIVSLDDETEIKQRAPIYYPIERFFKKECLDLRTFRATAGAILREGEANSMADTYLDFDLHVGHDGRVRACSNEGERTAAISLEVPNDVGLAVSLIEKGKADSDLLKKLGKRLYEIIFPGRIDTHFNQTEAVARSKERKVRIRLAIEPDVLARLPWEFTYREEGDYFLAVNPDTVLSRYLDLPLPKDRVASQEGPLHMLTIISNPSDQPPLDPDEWEEIVRSALARPCEDGAITIKTVKRATYEEIRDALHTGKPDIVQFVGHGIYRSGKGYLALVDSDTGKTWIVDDERFANIFLGFDDHLRLVCLATCESAKSDSPQGFLGIAPQVVERGTPAVVAMQYRVLVSTAKTFLENFYTAVAARKPVDWAVQQARNAVSIKIGLDNREFATPVLYMRAKDGNIF